MMQQFGRTVLVVVALSVSSSLGGAGASETPEFPASLPVRLIALGEKTVSLDATLHFDHSIRPEFAASYLKIWRIPLSEFGGQLHLEPAFEFVGKLDPQRRVCTELLVLDREGKLLYHDWELSGDGRIGPNEVYVGTLRGYRSRLSSPSFRVPNDVLPRVDRIDLRFRELNAGQLRHFPTRVHQCDARVTKPDANGEFEISFTNPKGQGDIEADCLVAFECLVYDSNEKLIRSDFRVVEPLPDNNRYRFKVRVEPSYYDYSVAGLGFFRREQGKNKQWLLKNLSAEWGVTHSGSSDGGKLVELPLEGVAIFSDLPELASR